MSDAKALPAYLVRRYQSWKATQFAENEAWFKNLATAGQHPRAMLISCCDSRVQGTTIFGADAGEFFIHRNIANLVPPYGPDGAHHGTSATVEYAVTALKVAHIIILGHSGCGGVDGCIQMCSGNAPALEETNSFVGRWVDILRPTCEELLSIEDPKLRQTSLEKRGVVASLDNLMTFPFVAEAVKDGTLSIHGVWHDIGSGQLEMYEAASDDFVKV